MYFFAQQTDIQKFVVFGRVPAMFLSINFSRYLLKAALQVIAFKRFRQVNITLKISIRHFGKTIHARPFSS